MINKNLAVTLDGIVFGLQKYGGISNYWGRLQQHLNNSPNIKSHIILPKEIKYAEFESIWHKNSSVRTEAFPSAVSRYIDVSNNQKCDVFHSSYFRVPSNISTRYVVTVYDFIYERYVNGPARWIHSWQKLRSIRRADAVICISNSTRNDVLRYVPDVDPSRVHVVYLGVDQSVFFPEPHSKTPKYESMVLYVGQRGGHKRFDLAVEAIAQCRELSLGIVGPALSSNEIKLLQSRLCGRWHSFGLVSNSRLRELYSTVFAFIYPSDYEGFGLPILEAMSCGCPVVAARTASLPEVGGNAAIYANEQQPELFATALVQLQLSTMGRRCAIEAGLQQVKKFSWAQTFIDTIAIYHGNTLSNRS